MTQQDQILAALLNGEIITPLDALRQFGCFRLAAAIHRLREDGYPIATIPQTDGEKHWAAYRLERDESGAIQMNLFAGGCNARTQVVA
jgi:hypothetical protein